jgi:uncharacterized protein YbcI
VHSIAIAHRARDRIPFEGSENWGTMPATSSDGSSRGGSAVQGQLAISTAVVHVFSEYTGRGPTKARTTIDGETVVVILQDTMTKAERSLVEAGKHAEVLKLRRSFQETMRLDLIAAVERLTASSVQAFMSANHLAPDTAAAIFLLDAKVGAATE